MKIDIEKHKQSLEELQTNNNPYLRFIIINNDNEISNTIDVYYGFTTCSCMNGADGRMCEHISFITNNFLIKNLKDIDLIDNRADISLYNFTKGDIMNIDLENIRNNIQKIIEEKCDCPICLEKIKVSKVKCTTCLSKYHTDCVLKTDKIFRCSVCRCDLDPRIY
jgi:hypothetical protein